MKKLIITAVICILIGLTGGWFFFHKSTTQEPAAERKIVYYRDPMNPLITSPVPKKSSDGMDFVAVYAEESAAAKSKKVAYYQDPMHPWYTSAKPGKAPDCGMDLVPVYEGDSELKGIKIDPAIVQNMGTQTEIIGNRQLSKTIRTTGKIDYDETKVFAVNSKIMGWVEKLYVDYNGQAVRKGEPLMDVYSPELVTTQQEYLQAVGYRAQLAGSARAEVQKGAEELVQSTRRRLLFWDIPESEIIALEKQGVPKKTMTLNSPANGIVIEKMVLPGQNIMPGMTLYKIADLSTVWILADIFEYELPWVKVKQQAEIELSYLPGKTFNGTVTYIYPYLSAETRTARVRIQIGNTPGLELKPEMFVTVKLISALSVDAVTVPEQAVIRSGERNIIVISLGNGYFEPREVKLGLTADGYTQIIAGAHAGEVVVTSSQFLIDSESNLKAAISSMRGHEDMVLPQPVMESADSTKETNTDEKKTSKLKSIGESQKQIIYTCVMHPQIRTNEPGDCPLCGMKLVPVETDSSSTGTKHVH